VTATMRETIALPVDAVLLRELDAIARAKNVSRHEAARIVLRLGIDLLRQQRGRGDRQLELPGAGPSTGDGRS
jgi:hypothetical protein